MTQGPEERSTAPVDSHGHGLATAEGQRPLRVLFTTFGAMGHFQPLVPYARGLAAAGHAVAFATAPYFVPVIEGAGFRCQGVGGQPSPEELRHKFGHEVARIPAEDQPAFIRQRFFLGEHKLEEIRDLLGIVEEWRPDLIVREEIEFAGCVAAERAGLPHAAVQISAAGQVSRLRAVSPPPLNALRAAVGLEPDPDLASFERYLYLSPFPPRLRRPDAFVPATQHVTQPAPAGLSRDMVPAWLGAPRERPLVYVTLGTLFNHRTDLLAAIIAALRDEPLELVVTVGRDQDPAQFGPQPPNVRIEHFIPQDLLYPHCAAAVIHGGSGTLLGALQHGLPLVILPIATDQPANAAAAQAAGVARVLDPERLAPAELREAVGAILTRTEYRDRARVVQAEIAALPPFEEGVRLLERLARTKAPLGQAT